MQYSGLIALLIFLVVLVIFLKHEAKLENQEEAEETNEVVSTVTTTSSPLNINDEDALVASLVASIDLRSQTQKNVQVISVREVK